MPGEGKHLYLTFDDGPDPDTTPTILEILAKYDVKATFFCVGENVFKHPETYQSYLDAGHMVGNHGYNHLKGWETETSEYIKNVHKCSEVVQSRLFRPPYGKIRRAQQKLIRKQYKIIMWTVLSRDYDPQIDREACLENSWKYTKPGAIVLFHDSKKSIEKLKFVLPAYLEKAIESGYTFWAIGDGR